MNLFTLVSGTLLSAVAAGASLAQPLPKTVVFNRDIRPILSDTCFKCHGPDKNARKAGFRLDLRADALKPTASGAVPVVPGKPDASAAIQRVFATDTQTLMPPPDAHKPLTQRQKELLKRWVAQGAAYQQHWAYEPLLKPTIPAGKSPVDYLVQAQLAERKTTLSPEADRRTLIRRLSFDLLGLPPTPQDVEAFVRDKSRDAYEKLVERLLASPHYGERMAQGWLDVVRFADTIGYHSDTPRNIWPYRDYVIAAFNNNKPFDQFTREQLAGDLLPNATQETRVGSAFNRLLLTTEEGGAQPKDYEARYLTDRVRAVGTVWLGQTTGCAQCHDHKFDPISQRDFYRLGAFFADIDEGIIGAREPGMLVPTPEQASELARRDARQAALQQRLDALARPLTTTTATALDGTLLTVQPDGAILASGPSPDKNTYTVTAGASGTITGLRLEVLPDPSLPARGPGRAGNGNFVLSEVVAEAVTPSGASRRLVFSGAQASFEQTTLAENNPHKRWSAASVLDPDSFGWAVLPEVGKPQELWLTLAEPLTLAEGETLRVMLVQNHGTNHTLGKFRLTALTGSGNPEALRKELLDAKKARTDYEASLARCLVSVQNAKPRTVRILPRGNFLDESGEVVTASTPAFLPGVTGGTRLDLANWLVSRENPLTARAVMNRLWKQLFGGGLSKVLDDLGAQGEAPGNPALLDWLAGEFQDSGWDVKHMVRVLVNSKTYKQVSTASTKQLASDPDNRLFARQGRFRLDAELVRDNALAIAGLLTPTVGGPSAKPYQPERYWENLNFPVRDWQADQGASQYRRGLYTWWQRSFLHPSLLAFDAPSREECTAERNRSNIPQQALVLLNDPTYVESARAFGAQILKQPEKDRLTWAWRQALQRDPSKTERATLERVYEQQRAAYAADRPAAEALLKVGQLPLPDTNSTDKTELAAWTHVARVLLNLHETITRP